MIYIKGGQLEAYILLNNIFFLYINLLKNYLLFFKNLLINDKIIKI